MRRFQFLTVVLALLVASCGGGTEKGAAGNIAAPPSADTAADDSVGEGIQVHGDWSITVVNPDGSVASATDFRNGLTTTGAQTLIELLAGQTSVTNWQIILIANSNHPIDLCSYTGLNLCLIVEPASPAGNAASYDLQILGGSGALVLTGSMIATGDNAVVGVATRLFAGVNLRGFTTTLLEPIDVLAGQQVFVTVTISFS